MPQNPAIPGAYNPWASAAQQAAPPPNGGQPGMYAPRTGYLPGAPPAGVDPAAPDSDLVVPDNNAAIMQRTGRDQAGNPGTTLQPIYGSTFQNDPRQLGNMPIDQGINETFVQGIRARQAANAAAQVVFQYDPATGRMAPSNSYKLDPTSAQYDPNQWGANNALMQAAGGNYAQGQANKTALPNQPGYQQAVNQAGTAAGQVGNAANMVPVSDLKSRAAQTSQLGQYGQDLGLLRATAMGQGPSAAQSMMQSQTDSNMRNQMAMAASARGGNIAAANRQAVNAGQNMAMQSTSQMSALRAQEQLQGQAQLAGAQSQLASALQGVRTGDQNAGMNNVNARAQAAQAANGLVAAQSGLTGAMQAQYGQGLQEQAMGLQYGNEGVRNQGNLMQLQAQVAQAAASGDQAALNAALQYYQLAQQGQLAWQGISMDQSAREAARVQQEEAIKAAQMQGAVDTVMGVANVGARFAGF